MIVTGEQLKAARAMTRLEQADLADAAEVSVDTVKRLERMEGPVSANVQRVAAIVAVLEAAGIEFTNGKRPGVQSLQLRSRNHDLGLKINRALEGATPAQRREIDAIALRQPRNATLVDQAQLRVGCGTLRPC